MTIDEAIKLLTIFNQTCNVPTMPILDHAIKLGINALIAIKEYRQTPFYSWIKQLPGETED